MPIANLEAYAEELYKSGMALEYYEKFVFDIDAKTVAPLDEIVTVIVPRTTWM